MERRKFIQSTGILPVTAFVNISAAETTKQVIAPKIKLSVSSYSYWHFRGDKYPIEKVIDQAALLGLEGIDVLHRQMESEDNAYLQKLKKHAFLNGIAMTCLSIHQGFVTPDEDGYKWCVDGIQQCLKKAEECGILLALENHWGLGSTPEGMLKLHEMVNSPWLGLLMDTGNFLEEPYDKLEKIASKTSFVQAKTYYGGGEWYSLELDYQRIINILKRVNYQGYISIEFEGKEDPHTGVKKSVELLRKALS